MRPPQRSWIWRLIFRPRAIVARLQKRLLAIKLVIGKSEQRQPIQPVRRRNGRIDKTIALHFQRNTRRRMSAIKTRRHPVK